MTIEIVKYDGEEAAMAYFSQGLYRKRKNERNTKYIFHPLIGASIGCCDSRTPTVVLHAAHVGSRFYASNSNAFGVLLSN